MSTQICSNCGNEVSENSFRCTKCGTVFTEEKGRFENIISVFESKAKLNLTGNVWKTLAWFGIANAAVILSVTIISGGILFSWAPFLLIIGSISPALSLLLSKYLAKKAHNIHMIQEVHFRSGYEEDLYRLVERMSKRAGLEKMPEVGIYDSEDINAFATGFNRNNSMIAYSNRLLQTMNEEEIAAVTAHEIGHIANGDMITMSIVQSVVNAFVLLITIPLFFIHMYTAFSSNGSYKAYHIIGFIRKTVNTIFLFLGNLVSKAFSRRREYEADKLASQIINKESMLNALKKLSTETSLIPKGQKEYATLKINSPMAFLEILSTHPPLEKRMQRLQELE